MISRILVPMDDSEMAQRALEYALENHPDAEITVLHVVGEPSPMGGAATSLALEDDLEAAAEKRARAVFNRARKLAAEHEVEITTEVRLGHPTRAILNRAEVFDAVVIGSHGGSMVDRLFVGNVAQKVIRQSPVAVIVVRCVAPVQAHYTADDDQVLNNLEQVSTARLLAELDPVDGFETQPCPPLAESEVSDLIEYHALRE